MKHLFSRFQHTIYLSTPFQSCFHPQTDGRGARNTRATRGSARKKKYGVDAQLEDGVSYPLFARAAIFFSIWIAEFVFSERDVNAAIFYMIYKSSALVTFLEA